MFLILWAGRVQYVHDCMKPALRSITIGHPKLIKLQALIKNTAIACLHFASIELNIKHDTISFP